MKSLGRLISVYNYACLIRNTNKVLTTSVRYAGAWNRDWKPGPYPKTQAEREAAAKKYGLHPKDYEPYPDDGTGYGDYPNLELLSVESRNPHEHYDYPELRRNFGEPIHVEYDMYTMDRVDGSKKFKIPIFTQFAMYVGVVAACFAAYMISESYRFVTPIIAPQLPAYGKTQYTFEKPT